MEEDHHHCTCNNNGTPSASASAAGSGQRPNEGPSTSSSGQRRTYSFGYYFYPTDKDIIKCLAKKVKDHSLHVREIHEVDIYKFSPLYLSQHYPHTDGEVKKWYFFTPRDRKYPKGKRPNRSVEGIGYWRATGAETRIPYKGEREGRKQVLVFYEGKPKSQDERKTNWIMHEYKLNAPSNSPSPGNMRLDDCVVCRIYHVDEKMANKRRRHIDDVDDMTPPAPFDPAPTFVEPLRTVPFQNENYSVNDEVEEIEALIYATEIPSNDMSNIYGHKNDDSQSTQYYYENNLSPPPIKFDDLLREFDSLPGLDDYTLPDEHEIDLLHSPSTINGSFSDDDVLVDDKSSFDDGGGVQDFGEQCPKDGGKKD